MNENNQFDVIIVGAGICGISLAALLANEGYSVLILEKATKIGGRARVIEKDGFILDYGIHTVRFGKKSALAKTLKTIQSRDDAPIEFKELGLSYFYFEDGKEPHWELLPTGLSGITKGDYFSIFKLKNVLFKLMMAKKKKNLSLSVEDWKNKKKLNEQGELYLELITASMQVCPFLDRASLGELRRNLQEVAMKRISVTYPIGGWKLIFDRLTEKIKEKSGKILTGHNVEDIIVKEKNVIGVRTEKQSFHAKKIVVSVPVQELFNFLNEDLCEPDFVELCKNLRPTGGLSLDIGLKKKISEETGLFYINHPISFGFFTSNIDEKSAPKGKQLFTICSPFNIESLDDPKFRAAILERIRTILFEGFPEMEENIEFERPLFTLFDGAEVNINQYREKRPNFIVPGIQNLYLVGDSTSGKGAGGDIGHNSVWSVFDLIRKKRNN